MNKTIAFLILGVIILALVLIMASQYKTDVAEAPVTPAVVGQTADKPAPATPPAKPQTPAAPTASQALTPPQAPAVPPAARLDTPAAATPTVPGMETPKPAAETPKPVAEAPKPAAEKPKPVAEAPKPTAEKPKPVAEKPKPAAETPKPAAETPKPAAEKPKPAAEKPKARTVEKINVRRHKAGTNVLIAFSEGAKYKSLRLPNPDRLVIDVEGIWDIKAPGVPDNRFVGNVRVGHYDKVTRIVLDLKGTPASAKFYKAGVNDLEVRLR